MSITIQDGITPFINGLRTNLPKEYRSSMFQLGGFFRKRIQESFDKKKAGSAFWPDKSKVGKVKATGKISLRQRKIGGRLRSAVKFRVDSVNLDVHIGWASKGAAVLGDDFESGQRTKVTEKVRKRFFAADLGLSANKKVLHQPARPIFAPILSAYKDKIPELVEEGIARAVRKQSSFTRPITIKK